MNKNCYFASVNTSDGFKSYFDDIFDSSVLDSLYIIKGGSGTGKSTMMKKIGRGFENVFNVEYFQCSSDPESVDGIIIDGRKAIIDGTAPHTADPKYPGVSDKIVNLGGCLDACLLKSYKKEIVSLSFDKQQSYKKGYGYLSAAGKIKREMTDMCMNDFMHEKMRSAAERFFYQHNYKGEENKKSIRLIESVSSDGVVRLNTFDSISEKTCLIINGHGLEYLLMEEFAKISFARRLSLVQSFDPILPDRYNALYFPDIKLSVICSNGEEDIYDEKYKVFNMERFISRCTLNTNRTKLRFANKCISSLVQGASDCFAEAKEIHEKIEEIYKEAVDFKKVNTIGDEMYKEISSIIT